MMADQNRPATDYPAPTASNYYPTTTHTECPYVAPPPQNQAPYSTSNVSANPYDSDPHGILQQRRATIIRRRIYAVSIFFIIIIGATLLSIDAIRGSQDPRFRVETLTLSDFNISPNSQISGTRWDARFTVRNPNSKIDLYYDSIEASIFYKYQLISTTTVAPFMQNKKNTTSVSASFVSSSVYAYVYDWDGINRLKARGMVYVSLRMKASVRFNSGSWWARGRRYLDFNCFYLPVQLSTSGTTGSLVGGSKHC